MYMDTRRLQQPARRSSIQTDVAMDNVHGPCDATIFSAPTRAFFAPPS
jgi:hypothetical protein